MRLRNSALALFLLAGCSGGSDVGRPPLTAQYPARAETRPVPLPPEAGEREGPAGTSGMGATRYDQVGYASWYGDELSGAPTASGTPFAPDAITAAHRTLPLGSHAEVTSLETGRTILVLVNDRGPGRADREIDLSRGAATALGMDGRPSLAVRVRGTSASGPDAAALAAGRPAGPRLDAPPAVLAALRQQLRDYRPSPAPQRRALPVGSSSAPLEVNGFLVQVAAFSSETRARALAASLRGSIADGGGLYRVRLGPFADAASAQRARDDAARRGYGDATIIVQP